MDADAPLLGLSFGPVEPRLVPLNALIGLCCDPGMLYPTTLADSGYRLLGIEVPVNRGDGGVVVDAVMFQSERNTALAGEAKSGSNIDEEQALRYKNLDVDSVIQAASITVRHPGDRHLQPLYCCSSDGASGVLKGLDVAGLSFPVLVFSDVSIRNRGSAFMDTVLQDTFQKPVATPVPPPRIVLVDQDSPIKEFEKLVMTSLVAALGQNRTHISIPALAEHSLRFFVIYGKQTRNKLIKRVDEAARSICERIGDTFEYQRRTGQREFAVVRFRRSPEQVGRQGRTQAYQAIERKFHAESRRSPRKKTHPNQPSMFDVFLDQGFKSDPSADRVDK